MCVCVSMGKAKDCFHSISTVLKYMGNSFSQVYALAEL